jgi:PAS domain S-box-containing protein
VAENKIEELEQKLSETYKQLHKVLQQQSTGNPLLNPSITTVSEQEFDYMILFDENAKIIDCTNDIQKKLGFTKDEMLNLTVADVVYLESYKDIKASLENIKKQGSTLIKSIHKKKDGSSLFVSEHITYLKERNMFICMVKQDMM